MKLEEKSPNSKEFPLPAHPNRRSRPSLGRNSLIDFMPHSTANRPASCAHHGGLIALPLGQSRIALSALAALALLSSHAGAARSPPDPNLQVVALKAQDLRLASLVFRLTVANRALCRNLMSATGLVLHGRDQYPPSIRAAAARELVFETPVAVEGVVEGSPAALAGIKAHDSLVAVNDFPIASAEPVAGQSSSARDSAERMIGSIPPASPIRLTVLRTGEKREFEITPKAACRIRAEVLPASSLAGQTDGEIAQFGDRLLGRLDDGGLAAVAAHELGHAILEHRRRLEAQGVRKGLLGEFGASRAANRKAEMEADRLSVHILGNAAMDPALLLQFWRGPGRAIAPDLFRSRAYPSRAERIALIEHEIAAWRSEPKMALEKLGLGDRGLGSSDKPPGP